MAMMKAVRFGPYELGARLGAGGMAETYSALRRGPEGFEQPVCIKRVLPALAGDARFVRSFLEEARLAARLRHANVVQVVDFGVIEDSEPTEYFMALELVDGLDLRALLSRAGKLDPGVVALIAIELGSALEHAHENGIVHRDVSPSNVLVSRAGEVKLADFGIAQARAAGETKNVRGKVPYLAPEYADEGRYDARSDLFSLGVVLYECLVGERPFVGANDFEVLSSIRSGTRAPLQVRQAPTALVAAIERLLAPDPSQRFATATELVDAIAAVVAGVPARRRLAELVRAIGDVVPARSGDTEPLPEPERAPPPPTRTRAARPLARATEAEPRASSSPRAADTPGAKTSMRAGGAALVLVVLAVTALGVVIASRPDDPAPPPLAPSPAVQVTKTVREPIAAEPEPEPPPPPPSREEPAPVPVAEVPPQQVGRATLEIVVVPEGTVFVDGTARGSSPRTVRVEAGEHVIGGGRDRPTRRTTVRVRPGERRRVILR